MSKLHRSSANRGHIRKGRHCCGIFRLRSLLPSLIRLYCLGFSLSLGALIAIAAALPLPAQEEHWKELNARIVQLYQQARFSDAVPLAQESLVIAEASFGPQGTEVAESLNNLAVIYIPM